MARIEFHFNAPVLVPYACRLLRKVRSQGLRVQVVAPQPTLLLLDQALWTFSALDFLTHCGTDAPPPMRKASGILLTSHTDPQWPCQVLVNLGETVPTHFEGFERVVEVVTFDDLNRAQGRARWKHYTQLGHELVRHDLAGAPS